MWPRKNPKHKFGAIKTKRGEDLFSSRLEARYFDLLVLRQKAGEVLFFLRQTPFHLPGGIKYVLDFMVFLANGDIEFIDTKGIQTPTFILKKKQVEELYPIEIKVVSKI